MTISSLRLINFRNFNEVELKPYTDGLNIIVGENGSGKTSLLEAIYYLSMGRSFRTSTNARLIRHATEKFSIISQLINGNRIVPAGVERDHNGSTTMRINEKDVNSIMELASFLPLRIINSQSHQLFESGPQFRRKYLDWGLFYHHENFLTCWRLYERALKQRNILLREKKSLTEVEPWTYELIKYGDEIHFLRQEYIKLLAPEISLLVQELLDLNNVKLSYQPGWDSSQTLTEVLMNNLSTEYRFGYTQYGPHRADFDLSINDVSTRHFLSRGQQKLLICAMIVAQGLLLAKYAKKRLIYLVDDLPSELDLRSKQKLVGLLFKQQTQVFITAIEKNMIADFFAEQPLSSVMKMFHVEHGGIKEQPFYL